jgi:two-component system cell cycle sensor histidine kinase PleC
MQTDQRAGLSELGDVVLVSGSGNQAVIALAPAGTWLPATMPNGREVSLVSGGLPLRGWRSCAAPGERFAADPAGTFRKRAGPAADRAGLQRSSPAAGSPCAAPPGRMCSRGMTWSAY